MNAHKIAEQLCIKAESLGLDNPTESMIAEAIDNIISNHLNEIDYDLRQGGHDKAADYLMRQADLEQLERQEDSK